MQTEQKQTYRHTEAENCLNIYTKLSQTVWTAYSPGCKHSHARAPTYYLFWPEENKPTKCSSNQAAVQASISSSQIPTNLCQTLSVTIHTHAPPPPTFPLPATHTVSAPSLHVLFTRNRLHHTSNYLLTELRRCVKIEVAVLGSLSLIVLMVSVVVMQHWIWTNCSPGQIEAKMTWCRKLSSSKSLTTKLLSRAGGVAMPSSSRVSDSPMPMA